MDSGDRDVYCKPLIGRSLLSIEKREHSWLFAFSGEASISTESLWRFLLAGRVLVTSEDHGHKFGHPDAVNGAQRVLSRVGIIAVDAATIAPSGDLTLSFGPGMQLQLLQTSAGYEAWHIFAAGKETICMGGGELPLFSERQ